MVDSSRPFNQLAGLKSPNSVLVRGTSALDILKQTGTLPGYADEQYMAQWLINMAVNGALYIFANAPQALDDADAASKDVDIGGVYMNGSTPQVRQA